MSRFHFIQLHWWGENGPMISISRTLSILDPWLSQLHFCPMTKLVHPVVLPGIMTLLPKNSIYYCGSLHSGFLTCKSLWSLKSIHKYGIFLWHLSVFFLLKLSFPFLMSCTEYYSVTKSWSTLLRLLSFLWGNVSQHFSIHYLLSSFTSLEYVYRSIWILSPDFESVYMYICYI